MGLGRGAGSVRLIVSATVDHDAASCVEQAEPASRFIKQLAALQVAVLVVDGTNMNCVAVRAPHPGSHTSRTGFRICGSGAGLVFLTGGWGYVERSIVWRAATTPHPQTSSECCWADFRCVVACEYQVGGITRAEGARGRCAGEAAAVHMSSALYCPHKQEREASKQAGWPVELTLWSPTVPLAGDGATGAHGGGVRRCTQLHVTTTGGTRVQTAGTRESGQGASPQRPAHTGR